MFGGLRFETSVVVQDWTGFVQSSVRHFTKKFGESPKEIHCNPSVEIFVNAALYNLGMTTSIDVVGDFDNPFCAIMLGRGNHGR